MKKSFLLIFSLLLYIISLPMVVIETADFGYIGALILLLGWTNFVWWANILFIIAWLMLLVSEKKQPKHIALFLLVMASLLAFSVLGLDSVQLLTSFSQNRYASIIRVGAGYWVCLLAIITLLIHSIIVVFTSWKSEKIDNKEGWTPGEMHIKLPGK